MDQYFGVDGGIPLPELRCHVQEHRYSPRMVRRIVGLNAGYTPLGRRDETAQTLLAASRVCRLLHMMPQRVQCG